METSLSKTGNILAICFGGNMRLLVRMSSIVIYFFLVLFIFLVTEDKYSLIYDLDPSIPDGSFIDNSDGSGKELAAVTLGLIFLLQSASFYFSRDKKWRIAAVILAALAAILLMLRVG